ncbi:MAG: hypothetical protein L0Z50_38540, partial [Verrucomicrobiales bacterium]|nr:hypothetical protein [Verrucomicrobiales bacterium]
MPFSHTTRQGKKYYLHTAPKKGGGVRHFVSTKPTGELAESIPDGFEIHETVNGQVHLRRKKPSLIQSPELEFIQQQLKKCATRNHRYAVEVNGDQIVIHESTTGFGFARELNPFLTERALEDISAKHAHYMPIMRFVLQDPAKRLFLPERYCFRGSVDDWISIGEPEIIE